MPMRCAIFGDIHGNTEALEAVFRDMEKAGVDRRVCLGDIVGYGAEPAACIRRIRDLGIDAVRGNHDSAAVGETPLEYFNPFAKKAIEWTAGSLGADDAAWLKALPLVRDYGGFTAVHSSLSSPGEWGYILDYDAAQRCLDLLTSPVCFIGHSHVPIVFVGRRDGSIAIRRSAEAELDPGARHIVNVGSVGQPRDGDPRACYGVFDAEKGTVGIRRVEYDIRSAQRKILDAGLPEFLAERLMAGR